MKRFLSALTAIFVSGAIALAANLPLVPSTPQYSEASQIIGTLNALIQQLNGQTGYAAAQNVTLGSTCTATSASLAITCNGQSGTLAFTGTAITVAATGTVMTVTLTDSTITTASACSAQWVTAFTAGSAVYVATVVPTANTLTIISANGGTTTNAVQTGTLAFHCT
jgi:hypothetical protein